MTGFTVNYKNNIPGVASNDLYLDSTGNLARTKTNVEDIIETCYHELLLVKGDYDFDINKGIPWNIYLEDATSSTTQIKISIYNTLIIVKGVGDVTNINATLNTLTGKYDINTNIKINQLNYELKV